MGLPEFLTIINGCVLLEDDDRYFDIYIEYAKATDEDILIQITAINMCRCGMKKSGFSMTCCIYLTVAIII